MVNVVLSQPVPHPQSQDPRRILTSIGAAVYDWDLVTDRIVWGTNAADVLGLDDLEAWSTGRDFAEIVEDGDGFSRPDAIGQARGPDTGSGVDYVARYALRASPDRRLRIEDTGRWFSGPDGLPTRCHGIMRVSELDAETGGPGFRERETLLRMLSTEITASRETRRPLTLFVVAVRNLALLNEELGFEMADAVLQGLAARIEKLRRRHDRLVRYSGNRFALILRGCSVDQADAAARRLLQVFGEEPLATEAGSVKLDLAIGAASSPDHAQDAAGLFRRAELALGLAKKRSGATFLLYAPAAFRSAARQEPGTLALDCAEILNGRRIVLARQPIVSATTREVAFHEVLLRVQDERGRVMAAADVVPNFERSGLIHLADARMLELTVEHLLAHPADRMSLNVSPLTLDTGEWVPMLGAMLARRSDVAGRLIVEVTETAAIRDPAATRRVLESVKAFGVSIAIDDFGAGHTSFRHLRHFPVDYLKIDGVFVQNLGRQPTDGFFVRALVDLAQHLGVRTIAEWVDDEAACALLASWGVDYLQGDFLGAAELVSTGPATRSLPTSRPLRLNNVER